MKQVNKVLGFMGTNLRHPSLHTHKFDAISSHLSDDIRIYKNPQSHTISFLHIPTKQCIMDFDAEFMF